MIVVILSGSIGLQAQVGPYQAAAEYSETHRGEALLIYQDGELVFEMYQNGYDGTTPHVLYSGTKSFACAMALTAIEDGLFTLDETIALTLPEFNADRAKQAITVRDLLNFTSGIDPGRPLAMRRARSYYGYVTTLPMNSESGKTFEYGGSHLIVFAKFLSEKLAAAGLDPDPIAYLREQVFDPIGLTGDQWVRDREGLPDLPGGASLTAREWAKYGQLILNEGQWDGEVIVPDMARCFQGSAANPYYGLTFWLGYENSQLSELEDLTRQPLNLAQSAPTESPWAIVAAGAAQQRLYVIPSEGLIVVRFGQQSTRFDDAALIGRILGQ
jgi:CubicO group peptidase (beta-lactamase class C family)